jgi:hypothetical protein
VGVGVGVGVDVDVAVGGAGSAEPPPQPVSKRDASGATCQNLTRGIANTPRRDGDVAPLGNVSQVVQSSKHGTGSDGNARYV